MFGYDIERQKLTVDHIFPILHANFKIAIALPTNLICSYYASSFQLGFTDKDCLPVKRQTYNIYLQNNKLNKKLRCLD